MDVSPRIAAVAAVVGLVALVPACGLSRACTAMGGSSGVTVWVAPDLAPVVPTARIRDEPQPSGLSVRVCLRESCHDVPVDVIPTQNPQRPRAWVPLDALPSEPVTVRVTLLRAATGAALVDPQDVEVHPVSHAVNGPGCGPVVQGAAVLIERNGIREGSLEGPGPGGTP